VSSVFICLEDGLCWGGRLVVWPPGERMDILLGGEGGWVWGFFGCRGFSRASNILLGEIVCLWFRLLFLESSAYIWNRSVVLR
jgi:hypothetical protein